MVESRKSRDHNTGFSNESYPLLSAEFPNQDPIGNPSRCPSSAIPGTLATRWIPSEAHVASRSKGPIRPRSSSPSNPFGQAQSHCESIPIPAPSKSPEKSSGLLTGSVLHALVFTYPAIPRGEPPFVLLRCGTGRLEIRCARGS